MSARNHFLKRANGLLPPDEERHDHVRKDDDVAERQNRIDVRAGRSRPRFEGRSFLVPLSQCPGTGRNAWGTHLAAPDPAKQSHGRGTDKNGRPKSPYRKAQERFFQADRGSPSWRRRPRSLAAGSSIRWRGRGEGVKAGRHPSPAFCDPRRRLRGAQGRKAARIRLPIRL